MRSSYPATSISGLARSLLASLKRCFSRFFPMGCYGGRFSQWFPKKAFMFFGDSCSLIKPKGVNLGDMACLEFSEDRLLVFAKVLKSSGPGCAWIYDLSFHSLGFDQKAFLREHTEVLPCFSPKSSQKRTPGWRFWPHCALVLLWDSSDLDRSSALRLHLHWDFKLGAKEGRSGQNGRPGAP